MQYYREYCSKAGTAENESEISKLDHLHSQGVLHALKKKSVGSCDGLFSRVEQGSPVCLGAKKSSEYGVNYRVQKYCNCSVLEPESSTE